MSLDERISTLIKRMYCASGETAAWDAITEEVMQLTGAIAALSVLMDLEDPSLDSNRFYGRQDSKSARGMEEYTEYMFREDPSLRWATRNPRARFCDSSQTVDGTYIEHDYVKWNRGHFGSTHWYVAYAQPQERLSYGLSLHFPAEQGPADPETLKLFRMLFEHMETSVWLGRRPFNPDSDAAYALLDVAGNVRELTRGARRLLEANDGLSVKARRVTPASLADAARLEAALARAASACATGAATTAVKVERPSGQRALMLTIKPLVSDAGPFGKAHCELLVHMLDGKRTIGSLHLVQGLFGLTNARSRSCGCSPRATRWRLSRTASASA